MTTPAEQIVEGCRHLQCYRCNTPQVGSCAACIAKHLPHYTKSMGVITNASELTQPTPDAAREAEDATLRAHNSCRKLNHLRHGICMPCIKKQMISVLTRHTTIARQQGQAEAYIEGFWTSWLNRHTDHTITEVVENNVGFMRHCNDCREMKVLPKEQLEAFATQRRAGG